MSIRHLLLFLCTLTWLSGATHAQQPVADEQARFLAGLPMAGTSLFAQSQSAAWAAHAVALDKAWNNLSRRQIGPIAQWMGSHFAEEYASSDPLLYMFSGPDFLYAHNFFPNANTYVLCGIEPIGPLPDVARIPSEALEPALAGLQKSLDSVLKFSFFITKDMKVDLQSTRLTGTLPVLYTFLARSGCRITDVELVAISPEGVLSPGTKGAPGVRITFAASTKPAQTLYYFSTDLSDGPVNRSGFLKWIGSLGTSRSFLKAASYLLHGDNFTKVRQRLLDQSRFIIQDDSGIPARLYAEGQWNLGTYGRYIGPLPLFKEYPQPLLFDLYGKRSAIPLPFSFGYRWNPAESTLLAVTRLVPIVPPAGQEIPVRRAEPVQ